LNTLPKKKASRVHVRVTTLYGMVKSGSGMVRSSGLEYTVNFLPEPSKKIVRIGLQEKEREEDDKNNTHKRT
jgi:hypothetical protein